MSVLDSYKVDLLSSHLQGATWEWLIGDSFFTAIDGVVKRGNIQTKVECVSAGSIFKFRICSTGMVIVPCDRCLEDLELRIETKDEIAVKLGNEYSDDGDCVVVPETEGYINLAQYIYEFIVLSMPITCTHEPGKCDEAMMRELSKHQAARSSQEGDGDYDSKADDAPVDERWSVLKNLINN